MSITPEVHAKTLTQLVATEIKVQMARSDVRQSQLARSIGKTEQWLSVRLRGVQPIDLNDMHLIAGALSVDVHDLLPTREKASEASVARSTRGFLDPPGQPATPQDRPRDNRPIGHPVSAAPFPGGRTTYLARPGRRRRDR